MYEEVHDKLMDCRRVVFAMPTYTKEQTSLVLASCYGQDIESMNMMTIKTDKNGYVICSKEKNEELEAHKKAYRKFIEEKK